MQVETEFLNVFFESIVHKRFTRKSLTEYIRNGLAEKIVLEDVDESGLVADYAFIVGLEEHYVDIFYLKQPYGDKEIYVTEICVTEG
jgi:hypothetical protein